VNNNLEKNYISLRNAFLPKKIKLVFVLESPPQGHGYVYDASGRISEVLFRAFMKLLKYTPVDKKDGLTYLVKQGIVLVNPIYIPVNKLSEKEADTLILQNYSNFLKDLRELGITKNTPIVLVKKNILRLLEEKLKNDGFNVINDGTLVPFPLHYHIDAFLSRCHLLMLKTGI